MIVLSIREVEWNSLPTKVLIPLSHGRYSIRYKATAIGGWVRGIVAITIVLFGTFALFSGPMRFRFVVAAACIWMLTILLAAAYPTLTIDTERRCVYQGWALFQQFNMGSTRLEIRDGDCIEVRVTTHDFEHRHNPLYQVLIRRPGFWRTNISLIELVFPPKDPMEELKAFAEAVAALLRIRLENRS